MDAGASGHVNEGICRPTFIAGAYREPRGEAPPAPEAGARLAR
jgi:hypothetical protein